MSLEMLVDDYIAYQREYEKKYGSKTTIFMEVGSFYEVYSIDSPDGRIGKFDEISKICNLRLMIKKKDQPMGTSSNPYGCGFKVEQVDRYLERLMANDWTVVMVEQVNPPQNTIRKMTRVITPATYIDSSDTKVSNNIIAIYLEQTKKNVTMVGISIIDLVIGSNYVYEYTSTDITTVLDEINRMINTYNPREILTYTHNTKLIGDINIGNTYHQNNTINSTILKPIYQDEFLNKVFTHHTALSAVEYLELERSPIALVSYILLLQYAYEHDNTVINKLCKPVVIQPESRLILESNAILQLEVYTPNTLRNTNLFNTINYTITAVGKRLFRDRLLNPISDIDKLNGRYQNIDVYMESDHDSIDKHLRSIYDLDRLHRRLSISRLDPTEFVQLDMSYTHIIALVDLIPDKLGDIVPIVDVGLLKSFISDYSGMFNLDEMKKYNFDGSHGYRPDSSGSFFQRDINKTIDEYQDKINGSKQYLEDLADELSNVISKNSKRSKSASCMVNIKYTDREHYYLSCSKGRGNIIKKYSTHDGLKITTPGNDAKITSENIDNK